MGKTLLSERGASIQDYIGIVLTKCDCYLCGALISKYTVPGNNDYNPSKITVQPIFALDLGFAMIVHKAQGRTLLKVILCLAHRPSRFTQMQIQSLSIASS